jgi:hypothetical protein
MPWPGSRNEVLLALEAFKRVGIALAGGLPLEGRHERLHLKSQWPRKFASLETKAPFESNMATGLNIRRAIFQEGELGMLTVGNALGIKVTNLKINGQAAAQGVKIGDFICGINDKPLNQHMESPTSATELVTVIQSIPKPLTLNINGCGAMVSATEGDGMRPAKSWGAKQVSIDAGCAFRFDMPVMAKKGDIVEVEFWIDEEDMDIGFGIEREGGKPLVYPYYAQYPPNKHCGK